MGSGTTKAWAFGAIVACALIALAGYFLAIKPQLDETAEAKDSLQSARDYNDLLDQQIATAKKTAEQVPEWRGLLAALKIDMPPLPQQPELHRLMVQSMADRKLPVLGLTYGAPTLLAAPQPVAEPAGDAAQGAAGAADGATATSEPSAPAEEPAQGESDSPAPPQQQTTEPAFSNLVGIPFTATTRGAPDAVMQWFRYLQSQDDRFMTVTGFEIGPPDDESQEGLPPVKPGDWQITVNLMAFSLLDPMESFPVEEPGTNPPYEPGSFTVPVEGDQAPAG